jgi:hypothetical protein
MLINEDNLNDLKKLNYHIHDKWFAVDELVFDKDNQEFRLLFGSRKNLYDECLKVTGVSNCHMTDKERVGIYDIYDLTVDTQRAKIYIEGCIPIRVTLDITADFEISITKVKENN